MTFKATAGTTSGAFSLMERDLPPGGRRPPPHVHARAEEAFFVLEGEVAFVLDRRESRAGPRSFVLVPHGTPHTFSNPGPASARILVLHAPAMDRYFAELEQLWSGKVPPTNDEEIALMRRHATEPAR